MTPDATPPVAETTSETATASAPAAAPVSPYKIPKPIELLLKQIEAEERDALTELGKLEAEYLARKGGILNVLQERGQLRVSALDEVAKKGGLDIDKARWNFDYNTMTLIRVPLDASRS